MSSERFSNNYSNRGFLCEFCNERLPTSDDMRIHLWICASKTNQCPNCNKYIQRSIFAYHVDNNCINADMFEEITTTTTTTSHDMNASSHRLETEVPRKFESLFEKVTDVHGTLAEACYQSEINHVVEKLQFNIIVMGSPRVGKSELINALCNGKNRAETSPSLNSCTKQITCYVLEDNQPRNPNIKPFKINFYDTPGIESWTDQAGEMTMIQFIEQTNPVCIIYCASPGSFANLNQLHAVLEYCKTKEIFCALVCTNMWCGNKRYEVIDEFEKELDFFGEKIDKFSDQPHSQTPHKVTFFGKGALCTMVNSIEYSDPDFSNQRKAVQGIDELIHGIMEALDQEKLLGWCYAVLYRRSYWEKISQKVGGFFQLRLMNLYRLITPSSEGTMTNFVTYLNERIYRKKS